VFINCLIDEFVKPGERLIGIGMFANIIPIDIPMNRWETRGLAIGLYPFQNLKRDNFILLPFLQTWTNAIPRFLSVTRVPRVRIPLVLIAVYATRLGLFIRMEKVALVSIT